MGQEFRINDTAGMRCSKIQKGIEELFVQKSVEVIKFSEEDIPDIENALDVKIQIINLIEKEGRCLILS